MKRTSITLPEETVAAVEHAARRRGQSVSATIRQLIEKQLEAERATSPFDAMIGIVSKDLPYRAADLDEELQKSRASAIEADRG
ncbi:MAG: ribbon-helix-helix protein, CopG family [Dehalococcoidia bacterium]|nr:ribbon-helix-helix protein, CopG family [Dehalococcoidia bacterium]